VKMLNFIYREKRFQKVKRAAIDQISTHFVGLVQLKNYSTMRNLIREIFLLIKFKPQNVLNFKFWFFSIGTLLMPRKILIWLTDNYKKRVLAQKLKGIID